MVIYKSCFMYKYIILYTKYLNKINTYFTKYHGSMITADIGERSNLTRSYAKPLKIFLTLQKKN